jgi:hypothetical protein
VKMLLERAEKLGLVCTEGHAHRRVR